MLSANRIIARAEDKAGFTDREPHLHQNLEALLASAAQDGRLSAIGLDAIERGMIARSADRIEGLKWLDAHPEISDESIVAPVFLMGLPRSGTTYLQYLFDHDRRFRLIRTWEGLSPLPPPGFDSESVVRRKAEEAALRERSRPKVANFAALHLHDNDGPEECHAFLEQSYAAAGLLNLYDVPAYFEYLMDGLDLAAAYRVHKRQLQLLKWKSPVKRWAVKYPNHVIAMNAIDTVYPDAQYVMTHRDPVQVLASISKMSLALRSVRYEPPVDPVRIGRQMTRFIRLHIDRIMNYVRAGTHRRVVHVDYYELLADPVKAVGRTHEQLGIGMPDDVRAAIAAWRRGNPKNARGANSYALEQFGLNSDELRELFSDYMRRFDIPSEHDGLARVGASA
jgi:hypothetical protein